MRMLFIFSLYLTASAYQQNPDPWAAGQLTPEQQRQWEQTQRNYQDHVRAEVRGTTAKSLEEPMAHKPTYNELLGEIERLKTELAAAHEATTDATRIAGEYFEALKKLKSGKIE